MSTKTVQGIKIYIDSVITPERPSLGLYTPSAMGDTSSDSSIIAGIADTSSFIVGRRVTVSSGMPDSSSSYRITGLGASSITLDSTAVSTYTDATVCQESELRWSENTLAGTAETWTSGIIAKNGISSIKQSADFARGGAPVQYDGLTVQARNTDQLVLRLKELGIRLTGLSAEVVEFIGTESDSDSSERTVIFSGDIEDPTWDETILEIPIKNNRYKRRAVLGTVINNDPVTGNYPDADDNMNGKIVPLTFGTFYPATSTVNNLAKFIRVAAKESLISNTKDGFTYCEPQNTIMFPVTEAVGTEDDRNTNHILTYKVKLGTSRTGVSSPIVATDNMFLKIIEGPSECVGKYRKIESITMEAYPSVHLVVNLEAYFPVYLKGNDTATATDQTWVQIVHLARDYQADIWPCKNYLSKSGGVLTSNFDIYGYDTNSKLFLQLPKKGHVNTDSNNNRLAVDLTAFDTNPDTMDSFLTVPCTNLQCCQASSLTDYGSPSWTTSYPGHGCYCDGDFGGFHAWRGELVRTEDGYGGVQYTTTLPNTGGVGYRFIMMFEYQLPAYPELNYNFDKVYIGHYTTMDGFGDSGSDIIIFQGRFIGTKVVVGAAHNLYYGTPLINNDTLIDNGYYFWVKNTDPDLLTGYDLWELANCADRDKYRGVCLVSDRIYWQGYVGSTNTVEVSFDQTPWVIFQKEIQVKDAIYLPFSGRKFNGTWGTRKTSTALINSPIDILEHVKRLQNWSERGDTGIDWGKAYAPSAKIKLSGDGSFDGSSLDTVKALTPARQVFDENDSATDAITKSLCQQYFLCSYTDNAGNECVSYLPHDEDPDTTITFADIIGDVGETTEPQAQDVFVMPFVRYCYNSGSEDFDRELRILNTHRDIPDWDSLTDAQVGEYFQGFATVNDGKDIWEDCHTLWTRFRQIEQPPSDMTDAPWINTYTDAKWFLTQWVSWMGKRRTSFSVPYTLAPSGNGQYGEYGNAGVISFTSVDNMDISGYTIDFVQSTGIGPDVETVWTSNGLTFYINDGDGWQTTAADVVASADGVTGTPWATIAVETAGDVHLNQFGTHLTGITQTLLFDLINQNGFNVGDNFYVTEPGDTTPGPTYLVSIKGSALGRGDSFQVSTNTVTATYDGNISGGTFVQPLTDYANIKTMVQSWAFTYGTQFYSGNGTDLQDGYLASVKGSALVAGDTFTVGGTATATFTDPAITFNQLDNYRESTPGAGQPARDWFVSKHINIRLPHQTNNHDIECVIEKIEKDKKNNRVSVDLVLLDEIPTAFFLT
jgi:hypothetical protein